MGNSSQVTKMVPEMTIKIKRSVRNTYVCVCLCVYVQTPIYSYSSPFYSNMISPPSQLYVLEKVKLSFPTQE